MSEYLDKIDEIYSGLKDLSLKQQELRQKENELRTKRCEYNTEYSKQFIGKCFESHDKYYLITGPAAAQYTLSGFIYDDDEMPAVVIEKKLKSIESIYDGEVDIGTIEMMKEVSTEVFRRTFIELIDKVIDDAQECSRSLFPCSEN